MRADARCEAGFTLIELLMVTAIISVLAVISGDRVMRARLSAHEASAIGGLRSINAGQQTYASSCAGGAFAIELADLATPPDGTDVAFVGPDLAFNGVVRSGYAYALARGASDDTIDSLTPPCNAATATPASEYFASADPVGFGARHFATDTRGSVYGDVAGPLANPIPPDAAVLK